MSRQVCLKERCRRDAMARKSRGPEIIEAIRAYLIDAVKRPEPITDERLLRVADCGRTTFYKYVTKGSDIEGEIEAARREQKKYLEIGEGDEDELKRLRKRLREAEEGNRNLLARIARMTANLSLRYGIPVKVIQAAQSKPIPHPDRNFSHAGRGRRRK
jgi:hypothetical protein